MRRTTRLAGFTRAVPLFLLAACGGSSSNPAAPETPRLLQGQTVSAIDGSGVAAASVRIGTRFAVQTDASGNFQVDVGSPGSYSAVVTGASLVERQTSITGPSSQPAKITIIPASFDLEAFDQMFRTTNNRLQRWTTRPSLVAIATVLKYVNGDTTNYQAMGEQLTEDETGALVAHLTEGLALMTSGTFTTFAGVDIERPSAGDQVSVRRTGKIVVARYAGVANIAQTIGYGSWAEQPDGSVVGGSMWLDRDFDKSDSRRRLLRIHELGHALGYTHVTSRSSIMNPAIGPEPTDFDRAGVAIAFQRPVGNVAPDTDPGLGSRGFSVAEGAPRWRPPIR